MSNIIKLKFLIVLALLTAIASCREVDEKDELIKKFDANRTALDSLVSNLYTKKLDSLIEMFNEEKSLIKLSSIDSITGKLVQKIGVRQIICHYVPHCLVKEYDIETNWGIKYPVYLSFLACNSTTSYRGLSKKDALGNNIWGLTDKWMMWQQIVEGKM